MPANSAELNPLNTWRKKAAQAIRQHFIGRVAPDIVHVSSLFEGLTDDAVTSGQISGSANSVTLYDLIPLVFQSVYLNNANTRAWYFRKLQHLKCTELLLAISEHSRQEAIALLNLPDERVVNVSAAVAASFSPRALSQLEEQELRNRYGLSRAFLMYTGGIDFRKNIENLINAYAQLPGQLRASYQLAIVCSVNETERQQLLQHAVKLGLGFDELVLTGFVPDDDLIALYSLCHLFIFPSLYEGFGLPALEAMACGAAVVGSNTSSIPEVIGRQDALFDPSRPAAIAEAIARVLNNPDFRQLLRHHGELQARRFSWQESARRALIAFENMDDRNRAASRTSVSVIGDRPRLAFVSPLPPLRSGIAAYSSELLPQLARHYDIELVVDQEEVDHPWLTANFPVRHIGWFRQNARRFDRILYQFGNSPFHQHMFSLLQEHPGVVVLHDFFLSGVVQWLDDTGLTPGLFRRVLYQAHGYPALVYHMDEGTKAARLEYPANKPVVDLALGIIVHSRFSFQTASDWYSPDLSKKWRVIPQLRALAPRVTDHQRQQLGFADEDFVICSFGIIDSLKCNDRLLSVFLASSLANDPHCHLILVGEPLDGDYCNRLLHLKATSPAGERVRITGFVNRDLYEAYLSVSDAAVQLRQRSRGETSRSVLDVLAHGLPLIVNACGTMSELPDSCVTKLPEHFSDTELEQALERVRGDKLLRKQMGDLARCYIREHHDPFLIAEQYRDAIECFSTTSDGARYRHLIAELADNPGPVQPSSVDIAQAATCIAANRRPGRTFQLLLSVPKFKSNGNGAVLPNETRELLHRLLRKQHSKYRVEPVYWDGVQYRYAIGVDL